jgi:hypothetical protein
MSLILSGTDGLSDVDGSAATPAIRGTDANTGIFFPAADTIAFSEGGVEAMRIDTSGNVGIGTSSPGAKLDVSSGAVRLSNAYQVQWYSGATQLASILADSGPNLTFQTGSSNTERMRIDSSGNVGIGTNSPGAKLEVNGNIRLNGGSNTLYTTSADLVFQSGSSGLIRFANNDGANERARITSGGDLLVGTTTASGKLTVNGVIAPSGSAGTYSIDTTSNAATYANGATVGFASMSGVIIANSSTTGRCTIYAMGAGTVTVVASAAGQCGTLAYSAGNNGYTWTNNLGSADTVAFMVFRTRAGA